MNFVDFINNTKQLSHTSSGSRKISGNKLSLDQTPFQLSDDVVSAFTAYATEHNFIERFMDIKNGGICNLTEQRSASHFQYRAEGYDLYEDNLKALSTMVEKINDRYDQVIFFGIGGSFLGPMLLNDAFGTKGKKINFVTGSDPEEYKHLKDAEFARTAFVLASKSFSTIETLSSYEYIAGQECLSDTYAITALREKAQAYGIPENQILSLDINTGGRFSIWSGINLAFCLCHGLEAYKEFLQGGAQADAHAIKQLSDNPALSLAMQDVYANNVLGMETSLLLNYDWKLRNFYQYAQQLDMESLGKSVKHQDGTPLEYQTGMIVWGGFGPRSQHSFYQHVFQGTKDTNLYVIATENEHLNYKQFLGQTKSLRDGNDQENDTHKQVNKRKFTTILLDDISPASLGELIAVWENKTIFNSMFWDINPFDQWGVELGKINTKAELEK